MAESSGPKGPRTETVVREFDRDGNLTKETTSVVTTVKPDEDVKWPGQYL